MTQENGWPEPNPGVLNPIDDPYAAAQQMAVAVVAAGRLQIPLEAAKAAEYVVKFQKALTEEYLKLRDFYDCSHNQRSS